MFKNSVQVVSSCGILVETIKHPNFHPKKYCFVQNFKPKEEAGEARNKRQLQDKLLNDGTERQVVKLTEEDIGASMQFLQSKVLCVVPISSVATIYHSPHHQQPKPPLVKIPDAEAPS